MSTPTHTSDERTALAVAQEDAGLGLFLALGRRLIAAAVEFAEAFGFPDPLMPDLPPVVGSDADRAVLRSVPVLYFASELEEARLMTAAETLAGLFVSGGLHSDVGPAASRLLVEFWQRRHERFAAPERQAFYAHLFGSPLGPPLANEKGRNTEFESLMIDLCEALYKADEDPGFQGGYDTEVPIRERASQLAANLLPRAGGMATFAAGELLDTIGKAVALFKQVPLQQALGSHGLWGAVQTVSQSYLGEAVDVDSHVRRGKTGMLVLAWMTENLPLLGDNGHRLLGPGDPVMSAAGTWLEASLTLHEHAPGAGAARG
jgi:hypothetical protein